MCECNLLHRAEHDRSSVYNELNNVRGAIDGLARDKVKCVFLVSRFQPHDCAPVLRPTVRPGAPSGPFTSQPKI